MGRFSYEILGDKTIEILVSERVNFLETKNLKFIITGKEVIDFKRTLNDAGFEWSRKFECSLDDPECK